MSLISYHSPAPHVGVITLSDPDNLNAMSEDMAREFAKCVDSLRDKSKKPRVLILTGAGKAFSAGGHLEMLDKKRSLSGEENRLAMHWFYNSFLSFLELDIPTIAALNGSAIGAGLCVACACDIRIAAKESKLGFTFTKLGLHPGMGAGFSVAKIVGRGRAAELLLTARVISSDEALTYGLVSKIVPSSDVLNTALEVAKEILACGPEATAQLLQTLRAAPESLQESLAREALCQSINYASKEFAEGLDSVKNKRAPKF